MLQGLSLIHTYSMDWWEAEEDDLIGSCVDWGVCAGLESLDVDLEWAW